MSVIKDRELVAQKLAEIAEKYGRLTPDLVVQEAKNPESILHNLFEWNDVEAGHQHRLFQARQIITSVRVIITTENKKISTVYYVRDPEADPMEQGYVSIDKLKSDKDLARESIVMEFSRATAYLQRARNHAEALGMQEDIEALIADVEELKSRLEA